MLTGRLMLSALLAVAASGLVLEGSSACPSVSDVLLQLERLPEAVAVRDGRVWLTDANLALSDAEGRVLEVIALDPEASCDRRAIAAADIFRAWQVQEPLLPGLERVHPDDDDARVIGGTFAVLLGAALGVGLPMAATLLVSPSARAPMLSIFETLAGVPLLALTTLAGHRLSGGRGHFGWALLGSGVAVTIGVVTMLLSSPAVLTTGDWAASTAEPWRIGLSAFAALTLPLLALELSHRRETPPVSVSVVPTAGGAAVGLGGRF